MNNVTLMGRLTRDVETHYTSNEALIANFTLAVNRNYKSEGRTPTDFINCVAWGKLAEFVSRYFHKGNMIAVVGSIQTNSWDRQDGKRQYSTVVLAESVYFTGERTDSSSTKSYASRTTKMLQNNHSVDDLDIDLDNTEKTFIADNQSA